MYTEWFKLSTLPFRLRPDPDFFFSGGAFDGLHAALRNAADRGHGMVCLLGDTGAGKTTLLHALARERAATTSVARILQPNLTATELLATLAGQFNLAANEAAPFSDNAKLMKFTAAENARGRTVLVLIDEAHRCSTAMLRELLRLGTDPSAPLLMLAGEPALAESLAPLLAADRLAPPPLTLQVPQLDATQIAGYVQHRLSAAGSGGRTIFEPETFGEILRYTGGTPLLINTLCDSAMVLAANHSMARVSLVEIRNAALDLKWVEYSERPAALAALAPAINPPEPAGAIARALEVRYRGAHVSRLPLTAGHLIVGRAPDSGLRLDSQFVSRQHCRIITSDDQCVVEDLDSRNGMLVNGTGCRTHRLAPHDQVAIGEHTLIYLEGPDAE
jgi:type II secretory pathway predicted ATPase ExeA